MTITERKECDYCKKRGKTWSGSDPTCAFRGGKFNGDNWNCATMNNLRIIANELSRSIGAFVFRDDMLNGSISVIPIPDVDVNYHGYIILNYYKNRGRTDRAIVVNEDEAPFVLDYETAKKVIEYYHKFLD